MWFRRDLRLRDHPALLAAAADGELLSVFVLDPRLWGPAGPARRAYLARSLRALDAGLRETGGRLVVLTGEAEREVPAAARAVGAQRVHVTADFGPLGSTRDTAVEAALTAEGRTLVRTDSAYAVPPGTLHTGSGGPFRVYTAFLRRWAEHGWPAPAPAFTAPEHGWVDGSALDRITTAELPPTEPPAGMALPEAGEGAAWRRWRAFVDAEEPGEHGAAGYAERRNRPDLDGTSRMSVHLKWGEVHPRSLLADLSGPGDGPAALRRELAWRDFYADVLHHRPDSARDYWRPEFARLDYDPPGPALDAWREGRTGFPIVDAGMRQLRASGWMHNRVRMIVASFLVKDLHVEWQHGARHFQRWLVDGDLASNSHGWQWVAGSGTDAAPFFRVFNPTGQGRRFDPDGSYVRRWVPELRDLPAGSDVHDPSPADREATGYPPPLVDHAAERRETLDRWERMRR